MGNVTAVCFEENPFQKKKGRQPSKNGRIPFERLHVSQAFLQCLFPKLSGIKDGDEHLWKV